jgi:hypothetical protein
MEAQRNASSYMFNIGFLMFLVSNTAFIAFGFKPDQLNERYIYLLFQLTLDGIDRLVDALANK